MGRTHKWAAQCGRTVAVALLSIAGNAQAQGTRPARPPAERAAQAARTGHPSGTQQPRLAPGMARYTDDVLFGDIWRRPQLSPRDRSLVVLSTLIATGRTAQLSGHLGRALNNGVTPTEASGVLTHLALYAGWPSAVSALDVYDEVYTARNIDTDVLRRIAEPLPPTTSEKARADATTAAFGAIAPRFAELTNDLVFDDLWRRSDLSVRDRSLVTIAALAAMGDDDQLDVYLRRGVEAGLTRDQIAEALTHLAFYAGFPRATKAMTVLKSTLGPSPASQSQP